MAVINPGLIGTHVGYCGSVVESLETAAINGQTFCQFFLGNPKSYSRVKLDEIDIFNVKNSLVLNRFPMGWCTHAPYMMSLTGYGGKLAWKDDTAATNVIQTKVLPNLVQELADVHDAGGIGVVVHPGSYGKKLGSNPTVFNSDLEGLTTVAETLNRAGIQRGTVLLENCAGEGSKLPRTLQDINVILQHTNQETLEHVGVCIDTAHVHGVGEYDLSRCEDIDRLFSTIDSLDIPLKLVHLNDSKVSLGAHRDLHESPGYGEIWGNAQESLKYFAAKCLQRNTPFVVECPRETVVWETILP